MFPEQAKADIINTITEFETYFTDTYNNEKDLIDFPGWIEKYDEHVRTLLRGFKTICFDNGNMVFYNRNKGMLENLWIYKKEKLRQLIKS